MSWETVSAADVLEEFTPQEKAAINAVQGADTNLDGVLNRTVKAARGSISAGGNPMAPGDTIPEQLIPDVISIARWRWLSSLPTLKALQTDARKDLAKEAAATLTKIAMGDLKTEIPAERIVSTSPGNAVERVSGNDRNRTAAKLSGL